MFFSSDFSSSAAARVDQTLAAIAAKDGAVRAFLRLEPDARERAADLDRAPTRGPLHGLPIAIKDIIDTAGLATEYGTAACVGHVPTSDADCVRRLREAGAVVVGKTVTTELAHLTPGATCNPHDLARTPGGSSSGSAAAVGAGMVPAALGTQTGGSVIRPASYCGVFGFKSSVGRTDTHGAHELARSFDTIGCFAATMADLAAVARILLTPPRAVEIAPTRPRIARLRTPFDHRGEAHAHALVDEACGRLAAHGAEIGEARMPDDFGGLEVLHRRVVSVEAGRAFAAYRGKLSKTLDDFLATGDAATYPAALDEVEDRRRIFDRLSNDFDALILPAATGEAPAGLAFTGDSIFSMPLSLLGPACVSLPFGRGPNGMPVGVQLVGRRGEDEALIAVAAWAAKRLDVKAMLA